MREMPVSIQPPWIKTDSGTSNPTHVLLQRSGKEMAEGVGFEPTLGFRLSLISSQVHSTTLPPFQLINLQPVTTIIKFLIFPFVSLLCIP